MSCFYFPHPSQHAYQLFDSKDLQMLQRACTGLVFAVVLSGHNVYACTATDII